MIMLENTTPSEQARGMLADSEPELRSMAEEEVARLTPLIEAAEADVLERRLVVISAADWEKFEAWVDSPAKEVPALRKLASTPPKWQE